MVIILIVSLCEYASNMDAVISRNHKQSDENAGQVPPILHFVIGQSDRNRSQGRYRPSSAFSFINYVTILAARRHLRPKKLLIHYFFEPDTFWWNKTKNDPEINPNLVKKSPHQRDLR